MTFLTPVPEPSTIALLGLSLTAAGVTRWRKRKARDGLHLVFQDGGLLRPPFFLERNPRQSYRTNVVLEDFKSHRFEVDSGRCRSSSEFAAQRPALFGLTLEPKRTYHV